MSALAIAFVIVFGAASARALGRVVVKMGHEPIHLTVWGRPLVYFHLASPVAKLSFAGFPECVSIISDAVDKQAQALVGGHFKSLDFGKWNRWPASYAGRGVAVDRAEALSASHWDVTRSDHSFKFRLCDKDDIAYDVIFECGGLSVIRAAYLGSSNLVFLVKYQRDWFDGNVCSQFRARGLAGFPKCQNQKDSSAKAQKHSPKGILSRISRGVRSFPLGAKIGTAVVFTWFAGRILFDGYLESGDRGAYRRSGLRKLALGWFLFGLLGAFWWLASPY